MIENLLAQTDFETFAFPEQSDAKAINYRPDPATFHPINSKDGQTCD